MRPIEQTTTTYDRIAPDYWERRRDRSAIQEHIRRFRALLRPGDVVVDVGCGPGMDTITLRALGLQVIGLDRSRGMLRLAQAAHPGAYVRGDMRRLPFGRIAAGLWVRAALLHLPREEVLATLGGFGQVLIPGGILYLSVKEGLGERWESESFGPGSPRFFTFWQPQDLDQALRNAGFWILDGWREEGSTAPWLIRLAQHP